MGIGEDYERKITPIRSNISRFSRGTVGKRLRAVRMFGKMVLEGRFQENGRVRITAYLPVAVERVSAPVVPVYFALGVSVMRMESGTSPVMNRLPILASLLFIPTGQCRLNPIGPGF